MHKPSRPIYPVICLQLQAFIWCGLRLQIKKKIYKFQLSCIDKIVYIWVMPLLTIVFSLLVHLFLKKYMQKILPAIYKLYKNSFSKIMLFFIVVHFECNESVVTYVNDATTTNTPFITWRIDTSGNSIEKVIKNIVKFVLKTLILFFILCWNLFKLVCSILWNSFKLVCLILLILFKAVLLPTLITFLVVLIAGFLIALDSRQVFSHRNEIDAAVEAINEYIFKNFVISTTCDIGDFSLFGVAKLFYQRLKTLFLFSIVFVPYYVIISAALYSSVLFFYG